MSLALLLDNLTKCSVNPAGADCLRDYFAALERQQGTEAATEVARGMLQTLINGHALTLHVLPVPAGAPLEVEE